MRYIELNPVRAGMVTDPAQYRWSSYRHNGLRLPCEHLQAHPVYLGIEPAAEALRAAYRALFRAELDEDAIDDIRLAIAQSQPLGTERFAERICAMAGVRRARTKRGRPAGVAADPRPTEEQAGFGF